MYMHMLQMKEREKGREEEGGREGGRERKTEIDIYCVAGSEDCDGPTDEDQ